jgi:DNA-binding MarR family transcriptional regulator
MIAARRRQQVANLYLQGWPQGEIAGHLQIAQSTVSNDLKRIEAEWRESSIRDFDTQRAVEVQKVDRVERESWAAWDRSQKPSQQARIKGGASEQNAERLVKNQVGDPRFLEQIHKCIAARRALLGLDAPTRIAAEGPVLVPLTEEQRGAHIWAIIQEMQQKKLAQERENESRTVEATFSETDGPGTAALEPDCPKTQDRA